MRAPPAHPATVATGVAPAAMAASVAAPAAGQAEAAPLFWALRRGRPALPLVEHPGLAMAAGSNFATIPRQSGAAPEAPPTPLASPQLLPSFAAHGQTKLAAQQARRPLHKLPTQWPWRTTSGPSAAQGGGGGRGKWQSHPICQRTHLPISQGSGKNLAASSAFASRLLGLAWDPTPQLASSVRLAGHTCKEIRHVKPCPFCSKLFWRRSAVHVSHVCSKKAATRQYPIDIPPLRVRTAMKMKQHAAAIAFLILGTAESFTPAKDNSRLPTSPSVVPLHAAPKRLADNVPGTLYVNDRCINCAACAGFAPTVFERRPGHHVVHTQPQTEEDIEDARAALSACPVAAIRIETTAQRRHRGDAPLSNEDEDLARNLALSPKINGRILPFPRPLVENVWYLGHHNEKSFGATPYLTSTTGERGEKTWIMIDTPRFGKSAVDAVLSLTGEGGPDYLMLTHVDDTADHQRWREEFPNLKRIFHSGDLNHNWLCDLSLEDVEILLEEKSDENFVAFDLEGKELSPEEEDAHEVVIYHTPGHSPGSISMLNKGSKVIFTGDTLGYTTNGNTLTGFPRYGNNLLVQTETLDRIQTLDWDIVAPGHGHVQDYSGERSSQRDRDMEKAKGELATFTY